MRTDECVTCSAVFTQRPNHPGWEFDHCNECYRIVAPLWNEVYVTPAAMGRAIRAEAV